MLVDMKPCLQHEFMIEQTQSNLDLALAQANTYLTSYMRNNISDQHLMDIRYVVTLRNVQVEADNWSSNRNYRYNFVADFDMANINANIDIGGVNA
jgi:hypothetical protein